LDYSLHRPVVWIPPLQPSPKQTLKLGCKAFLDASHADDVLSPEQLPRLIIKILDSYCIEVVFSPARSPKQRSPDGLVATLGPSL
jgi:hypothetical protein